MTATTHARLTVAERAELMAKAARASVVVENRQRLERVKVGLGQMEDTLRRSLEHVRKYDVGTVETCLQAALLRELALLRIDVEQVEVR